MVKIWFLILFTCVCEFSHAQLNYYNRTIDIESVHNGFHGIVYVQNDTALISGFLRDINNKRYRTFCYINTSNGDTLSMFKYGNDTLDIYGGKAVDVIVDNDFLYCCGTCYKNGITYANFLKFDLNGNLILDTLFKINLEWSEFESMVPTNDGNFLILGSIEIFPDNLDAWLVKIDPNGNILWEQTYGGSEINGTSTLVETIDGNFLIASVKQYSSSSDCYILKIDPFGEIIWEKIIDNSSFYEAVNCNSLTNGDIILTGFREYQLNKNEAYVSRLNSDGQIIWENFFEKSSNGFNSFIFSQESVDGNILINGGILDELNGFNPVGIVYCLTPEGDSIWSRKYLARENDNYLIDMMSLENGDILMAGYVFPDSPDNTQDGWIIRTNCLGYFEHPIDSIVFIGSGSNIISITNYSSFYEYTIIDWGDNSNDTLYESGDQNLVHEYSVPGNYIINSKIIACNDTIQKSYQYLVVPEQYASSELVIFPNPNQGQFEIWLDSPELYSLEIIDMNGRLIKGDTGVQLKIGYSLDLSEFESSVYIVRVRSGSEVLQCRVVITK